MDPMQHIHLQRQTLFEILAEIEQIEGETGNCARDLKTLEQLFLEELQPYDDRGYHQMKSN